MGANTAMAMDELACVSPVQKLRLAGSVKPRSLRYRGIIGVDVAKPAIAMNSAIHMALKDLFQSFILVERHTNRLLTFTASRVSKSEKSYLIE